MLLLRQVRQQCVGALRASSSTTEKAARNESEPATRAQVEAACVPEVSKSTDSLVRHLEQSMIHVPGRFVIVQKPFNVSCYNINPETAWSRFSKSRNSLVKESAVKERNESLERPVILVDCIPQLSKLLHEPQLGYWAGLKRYVSGPIVLPCGTPDYDLLWKSELAARSRASEDANFHMLSALALVVGRPKKSEGTIEGYVAFEQVHGRRQYFFVEGPYSHRTDKAQFISQGGIAWSTIASGHDCSLLHVKFSNSTIPRFALSHLSCPILGDSINTDLLFDVNGSPVYVDPVRPSTFRGKKYTPHQLIARLGPDGPAICDLPMYFHVQQQVFPKYGGSSDLVTSAPLTPHFEAMVDLLGFGEAFNKFVNESEPLMPKAAMQQQLQKDHPPLAIDQQSVASSSIDKGARNEPKSASSSQIKAAYMPEVFKSTDSLVQHLEQSMIRHEPGRFVILQKPYGVSCNKLKADYSIQRDGMRNEMGHDRETGIANERPAIIVDCIPQLSKLLHEPQLGYWAGLQRYVSGPIVLPCSSQGNDSLWRAINSGANLIKGEEGFHKFSALALVIGRPERDEGTVEGNLYAEQIKSRKMAFFAENSHSTRCQKTGRYMVHGSIAWSTIASGYDCSLLHLQFNQPVHRLALAHLDCPILGDSVNTFLVEVDGRLINLKPSQAAEYKGEKYIPHQLIARLGPDAPPLSDLPIYLHVLQQVFPNYDGSSDLVASAPVPPHFEAMIDLLGFGEALKKYQNENTPISPSLIQQS